MDTIEIVKKAFTLPFRAYKGFISVIFLFFISEIINERINMMLIEDLTFLNLLISPIVGIIILGICIAVVYHYIHDSYDIRELSLMRSTKAGFKDNMIEFYYYSLTIIATAVISFALGIYHNIFTFINNMIYVDAKFKSMNMAKLLSILSAEKYNQLASSVVATLAIFVILFAICFSYCSLAKIRLMETGDMKESMDFIKLTKIIKSKGIKKYLSFVVLTFLVLATVLLLMKTLESYYILGSLISAITEAFALFFILDSFSLFYYS